MAIEVSATDAARTFSDLLNRVRYRGESFDVVRNGEVVARISAAPGSRRGTLRQLIEVLRTVPSDDGFADDLERVQAEQPALPPDPWAT